MQAYKDWPGCPIVKPIDSPKPVILPICNRHGRKQVNLLKILQHPQQNYKFEKREVASCSKKQTKWV